MLSLWECGVRVTRFGSALTLAAHLDSLPPLGTCQLFFSVCQFYLLQPPRRANTAKTERERERAQVSERRGDRRKRLRVRCVREEAVYIFPESSGQGQFLERLLVEPPDLQTCQREHKHTRAGTQGQFGRTLAQWQQTDTKHTPSQVCHLNSYRFVHWAYPAERTIDSTEWSHQNRTDISQCMRNDLTSDLSLTSALCLCSFSTAIALARNISTEDVKHLRPNDSPNLTTERHADESHESLRELNSRHLDLRWFWIRLLKSVGPRLSPILHTPYVQGNNPTFPRI